MENNWQGSGNEWLCKCTSNMYKAWAVGKTSKQKQQPYKHGFSLPQWVHNAIEALNTGNEEAFKAIKMIESAYMEAANGKYN